MKELITVFFLAVFSLSTAQSQISNHVRPHTFQLDNYLENNKISVSGADGIYISGSLSINIQQIITNFNFAETKLAIVDGQNVLFTFDGPTFYKGSDFYNDSYLSTIKTFGTSIPGSVVSNIFSNYPNAKFVLRYRFRVLSDGFWFPRYTENIGDYYTGDTKYGFIDKRTDAIIEGPSSIETEGTYTIINAKAVYLLDSQGNPTQNATLQNIGNGKYLVKRVGSFLGSLLLKAINNEDKATFKTITILGGPTVISGSSSICSEAIYTITDPGTVTLENASGVATLTHLGGNQYKVSSIGNATAQVQLKSVKSGQITTKEIIVGGGRVVNIFGPISLNGGQSYTYSMDTFGLGTYQWTVSSPFAQIVGSSNGINLEIQTLELIRNQTNVPVAITGTFTSECGQVTSITINANLNP